MLKSITFEQFTASAVYVSDIRPFHRFIDGELDAPDSFDSARAAYFFMECFDHDERDYEVMGYIFVAKNGLHYANCGNQEIETPTYMEAVRFVWENHAKFNYSDPQKYLFIQIDSDGEIEDQRILTGLPSLMKHIEQTFQGDDLNSETTLLAQKALSTIGARYFEYRGGHLVAFPIE